MLNTRTLLALALFAVERRARDGWTGWSWNRKLLPDAETLLPWFHSQGLHVTLNLHPADGVGPLEDAYPQFMRDMGADPATKQTISFDAGSPPPRRLPIRVRAAW